MRDFPRRFVPFVAFALVFAACQSGGTPGPATTTGQAVSTATAAPAPKAAIKLGVLIDLSGRFISFGKDIRESTALAAEEINKAGGVNGSKIELVVIDSAGDPEKAVVGYRELSDKGVFAVLGPISSGEAEVAYAQASRLETPILTGTANKEGITEIGKGWAFRDTASNTDLYTVALPAWAKKYNVKTAVLVFDAQEPVSSAAAKTAIPAVAKTVGITIVNNDAPITFNRGQTDFTSVVQRIKGTPADGLIIMSGPAEAGLIARELARQGEARPIVGHPAQNSNTFYEQGGVQINKWVLPSIFDPDRNDPAVKSYVAEMKQRDKEPPTVPEAANYYDIVKMVAKVLTEAKIDGGTDVKRARADLKKGLSALKDYPGVGGKITFTATGDADKTVFLFVVNGGKIEALGN